MISAENGILQRAAAEKEVCLKTAEQLCFAVILRSENILTYFLSKINIRTGVFQMTASYPERVFLHVTETVSTNDDVKKMIYSGDDRFALLSADTQSGGRGRLGRSFLSPEGGVYFSAAYPLSGREKNIPFLTLAAGLAAAEAIDGAASGGKMPASLIKWPNDIYINGKKVCGILTELVSVGGRSTAIVGIGINVKSFGESCPAELKDKITALNDEGIFPDRCILIRSIAERLDRLVYSENVLEDVPDSVLDALNSRSFVRGKEIVFSDGSAKKSGVAASIERDGSLRVVTANGDRFVKFGEITAMQTR